MKKEITDGRRTVAEFFWANRTSVCPRDYCFGLGRGDEAFIDTGTDSIVVRQGSNVIKFYNFREPELRFGLTLKQLLFYQEITHKAAEYLQENPRGLYDPQRRSLARISVLPVEEVGYSRLLQTPFTVSRYVPGDNFLYGWASEYGKPNGYRDEEVMGKMRQIGREISEQLGVRGINIARANFKIVAKPQQDEIVITDLCASITRLGVRT